MKSKHTGHYWFYNEVPTLSYKVRDKSIYLASRDVMERVYISLFYEMDLHASAEKFDPRPFFFSS